MGATVGVYMDKESLIGRRKEERDEHIPRRCLLVYGVASKAELMRREEGSLKSPWTLVIKARRS